MYKTNATARLSASTQVVSALKGARVGEIIDKSFHNAEFDEQLDGAVGDNDSVSKGKFYTSIGQVEMRQLDEIQRAGLKVTGVAIASDKKRLVISFTC